MFTVCARSLYFNKDNSVSLSYMNAAKLSISKSIAALIAVNPTVEGAAMTSFVIAIFAAAYTASPAEHAAPINGKYIEPNATMMCIEIAVLTSLDPGPS